MNKRLLSLLLFVCGSIMAQAQLDDFDAREYEVMKAVPEVTLDSIEAKEDIIYIFDRTFVEYIFKPERESYYRWHLSHTLKYINDENAIEEHNKLYVQLYDEKSIENLVVRVYKDGKLVSEAFADEMKTVELEKREVKLLALKGVEKGCMIETLILKQLAIDYGDVEYFQDDAPRRNAEFRLYSPKMFRFKLKSYNGLEDYQMESSSYRRIYHINQNNIPALRDEKYTFQTANRMRVQYALDENVEYGLVFNKFSDMGNDFYSGIMADYSKGRKVWKKMKKSAKITGDEKLLDQVFALENWIKSNYISFPGLPSQDKLKYVLSKHYGSQRDILKLFMYSFYQMGVDYEIVLTVDKTRRTFDPDFESWNYLTDVLFYFPESGQFLDPLNMFVRLGRINSDFLGQEGLFCAPKESDGKTFKVRTRVKSIDKNPIEKSTDVHTLNVKLSSDMMSCTIDYKRSMLGYADMTLRSAYYSADEDDRNEFIEEFVKGEAKESEIEIKDVRNYNMGNEDEYEKAFEIDAELKTSYYVESAGDKILLKVGELIGAQTEMYSEEPRQQPISLDYAHKYVRHITVEIPEGYQAKGLEKLNIDLQYKNPAGEYSMGFTSKYEIKGNKVIITCEEYYSDLSYPIMQYDDFAKVINAAADFNKISILIEKK